MEYRSFIVGELATNCYLLWSEKKAGVIDPGGPVAEIVRFLESAGLELQWIINTHGHCDHIAGNGALSQRYQAPVLIHVADRAMLLSPTANLSAFIGAAVVSPDASRTLADGETVRLGPTELQVIATPGHTRGGIALYTPGLLFAGDTLFCESIGRTDFPGGDQRQLLDSIRNRLFTLPPETLVLPGHGATTTIGREQKCNLFLRATDEV
jgi:hydroxyacylglutathione hydrolase